MSLEIFESTSIVIPVAPGDLAWRALLPDLAALPSSTEIIMAGAVSLRNEIESSCFHARVKFESSPLGRAVQLNTGARRSSGRFLWFLHADSRITEDACRKLQRSAIEDPRRLLYLRLRYLDDGPPWMVLNELGAFVRSLAFGLPFGDQGFFLPRDVFDELGGFDESAEYGEDHLLAWTAKRARIPVHFSGAEIATSARKYRQNGWLRTTLSHSGLWARQAFSEFRGRRIRGPR